MSFTGTPRPKKDARSAKENDEAPAHAVRNNSFQLFGKRKSTGGTTTTMESLPLEAMFRTDGAEDDEFEFSTEFGQITALPRVSALSTDWGAARGLSVQPTGIAPRVSDLKAEKAPVYVGKTAVADPNSKADYSFKQSNQSLHKVPEVVKKLIKEEQPEDFEWPDKSTKTVFGGYRNNEFNDDTPPPPPDEDELLDIPLPPPPPM